MLGPATLNHAPFCVVTIETVEGMNHVEAIAATPGIDCLMLGGKDLAVDMGLPLTDIYSGKTPPPVMDEMDKLIEADAGKVYDKVGRAYGILQNSHLLSSSEAMNLLSLIRLGIDLGTFPDANRSAIDRLFIEAQPGHLQHAQKGEFEPTQRDVLRASRLRSEFANFARPDFNSNPNGKN